MINDTYNLIYNKTDQSFSKAKNETRKNHVYKIKVIISTYTNLYI